MVEAHQHRKKARHEKKKNQYYSDLYNGAAFFIRFTHFEHLFCMVLQ